MERKCGRYHSRVSSARIIWLPNSFYLPHRYIYTRSNTGYSYTARNELSGVGVLCKPAGCTGNNGQVIVYLEKRTYSFDSGVAVSLFPKLSLYYTRNLLLSLYRIPAPFFLDSSDATFVIHTRVELAWHGCCSEQ